MGTFEIDSYKRKNNQGLEFSFECWTTSGDMCDEENGSVSLRAHEIKNDIVYGIEIPNNYFNEKYMKKWFNTIMNNKEWRKQFNFENNKNHIKHKTKSLKTIKDEVVEIDENIYEPIKKLNDLGCITKFCCEGGEESIPYITSENGFPKELMYYFNKLGYDCYNNSVYASCAWHWSNQQSKKFQLLLNDWCNNNLNKDIKKYLVDDKDKKYKLPTLPTKSNEEKKKEQNKCSIEIQKLNNRNINSIKFKEMMNLKSGRDKFSSLKYNKLIEDLDNNIINEIKKEFEENDLINIEKTLRWIKRGLKVQLSIRKVKTDLEVAENYSKKRRK